MLEVLSKHCPITLSTNCHPLPVLPTLHIHSLLSSAKESGYKKELLQRGPSLTDPS